jgi:hypothetical protein
MEEERQLQKLPKSKGVGSLFEVDRCFRRSGSRLGEKSTNFMTRQVSIEE